MVDFLSEDEDLDEDLDEDVRVGRTALEVLAAAALTLGVVVLALGDLALEIFTLGDFLGDGFLAAFWALCSRSWICFLIRWEESWIRFRVLAVSAVMSSR